MEAIQLNSRSVSGIFIQHSVTFGFVLLLCNSYVVAGNPLLLFSPILSHPVLLHNYSDVSENSLIPQLTKLEERMQRTNVSYQPTSGHCILGYVIIRQSFFSPLLYLIYIFACSEQLCGQTSTRRLILPWKQAPLAWHCGNLDGLFGILKAWSSCALFVSTLYEVLLPISLGCVRKHT